MPSLNSELTEHPQPPEPPQPTELAAPPRHLLSFRWILSHLFVLLMVVVMINLGFWQMRRLEERRDSNSGIRAALQAEPQEIGTLLASPTPPPDHTRFWSPTGLTRPSRETGSSRPLNWRTERS